jgi:hypothetical protein
MCSYKGRPESVDSSDKVTQPAARNASQIVSVIAVPRPRRLSPSSTTIAPIHPIGRLVVPTPVATTRPSTTPTSGRHVDVRSTNS